MAVITIPVSTGIEVKSGIMTFFSGGSYPAYESVVPTVLNTGEYHKVGNTYYMISHGVSVTFFAAPQDISSLQVIRCTLKILSAYSFGKTLTIGIPRSASSIAETGDNRTNIYNNVVPNAQTLYTFPANTSFAAGVSISLTKAQVLQILQYGLSASSSKTGSYQYFTADANDVYIEVEYADPNQAPTVTAVSPNGTSVTTGEPITFVWSYSQTAGVAQASYSLDISTNGTSWTSYASDVQGSETSFTLPAGTLTTGSYQWRIKAKSANGVASEYSIASFEAIMGIYMPSVCTIIRPRGATIIGTDDNTFEWSYSQSINSPQTHYDLQISYNSGTTWTTLKNKVASSAKSVVIAKNTLNTGSMLWRARTYHSNGSIVSAWDETAVIVYANPGTATIQCDARPRPKISWNTISGQQAFQVQIVRDGETIHDSRTVYNTDTSYIPDNLFLLDGVVTVRMRAQNNLAVWGDWAEIYSDVKNTSGAAVTLTVEQVGYNVLLLYTTSGTYAKYYIYRDGKLIAVTTKN